jgi:transposase
MRDRVLWEAKAMTRKEVIVKAIEGRITWLAAADILGVTPRHLRRLKEHYERTGYDGLADQRGGKSRRKRIPVATIRTLCRLRREQYFDFSIRHFWERATEQHGLRLSYTWTRVVLQAAGLAPKAPGRGQVPAQARAAPHGRDADPSRRVDARLAPGAARAGPGGRPR